MSEKRFGGLARTVLSASLVVSMSLGCDATGPNAFSDSIAEVAVVGPVDAVITKGDSLQLGAIARDGEGNPVTGASMTWSSSDISVATVRKGMVKGRSPGEA